jgi:DNA (cytosine-5)-methyltransferase 1
MSYGFGHADTANVHFDVLGGLDVDAPANATYEAMVGRPALHIDVRTLEDPGRLAAASEVWGLVAGVPTVLIGCGPCQGFSSHRKKDPRDDDRDSLIEVFGRVAARLQPDLVLMENVPEMLAAKHWHHFSSWKRSLEEVGYRIRVLIYNLAGFGVPQERFRALAIAARDWRDFEMPEPSLTASEFVTVRDAIGHLPPLNSGQTDPLDEMHQTSRHRKSTVDLIRLIPPDGGSRAALPPGVGPKCWRRVDGFRDVYGRLAWDRPAVAITARCRTPSCGRFVHPDQHRGLSVREAALLQGFPSDYVFRGPFDDRFKQIGNAVSPRFAKAIAEHLDNVWARDHELPLPAAALQDDIVAPLSGSFSSSLAARKRAMRREHSRLAMAL